MKCEICSTESEKVETLTLCPTCFDKLSNTTEFLLLENLMMKLILKKLILKDKNGDKNEKH